ncbi:MAG: amphi-Trp domain-containing protein [Myxococcales bacterium]|nr:amphi-Trp domain-containing protein [Myxococcales bacterium]
MNARPIQWRQWPGGTEPHEPHDLRYRWPALPPEEAMATRKKRAKRDIEKNYPRRQFIAKLRRLADCLERGERLRIQVAGERVSVPPDAVINIEHERGSNEEEIEFQLKWTLD